MRNIVLIPAFLLIALASGVAACAILGWNIHPREMSFALVATIIASIAGVLPVFLSRHATQIAVSQAGLLGTVAHLFIAAAFIGIVVIAKLPLSTALLGWSATFYWTSLAALVLVINRAIHQAPLASKA